MKIRARSVSNCFTAAALVLAMSACGDSGADSSESDGDSGDSDGDSITSSASFTSVDDLVGRLRTRYQREGVSWATDFVWTGEQILSNGGSANAIATGTHMASSLSLSIAIDIIGCSNWALFQATTKLQLDDIDIGETFICNWTYTDGGVDDGGVNWYALSISGEGVVSGSNVFIPSGSTLYPYTELAEGRGAALEGEHEPDYVRSSTFAKTNNAVIVKAYEDLEQAVSR